MLGCFRTTNSKLCPLEFKPCLQINSANVFIYLQFFCCEAMQFKWRMKNRPSTTGFWFWDIMFWLPVCKYTVIRLWKAVVCTSVTSFWETDVSRFCEQSSTRSVMSQFSAESLCGSVFWRAKAVKAEGKWISKATKILPVHRWIRSLSNITTSLYFPGQELVVHRLTKIQYLKV